MARVLVTEEVAEAGLERLRAAGHEVDVRLGLDDDGLLGALQGAAALIIRSATQVTAEVLDAVDGLLVVGRAGIGLDNVDVRAATRSGVMVVNAPLSNSVSAAEHTMALLLAQARNVPQAHADLVAGRWNRSQWAGVELSDKTLGIIGLGRIGRMVAHRATAFGMRCIAHDPFVTEERALRAGVEMRSLEDLMAESDFVTLHLARTPETVGLLDAEMLKRSKPGLRLVNVARGGIVDEEALAEAVSAGIVAGAAIDVFASEPTTESPLFGLPGVIVTPHLGASTVEAQDKAGITIAEQVELALAGDYVPFAVNVDVGEAPDEIRPFVPLAEQLGAIFGSLVDSLPERLDVEFRGAIGAVDDRLATLAVVKGLLDRVVAEAVTYVNAGDMATERGMEVRTISTVESSDFLNLITLRAGSHALAGTLVGIRSEPRIVMVDDHAIDLPPSDHMVVVRNEDQPGMIGVVGTALGDAGVNVADMAVGHVGDGHSAIMVLSTGGPVPTPVLDDLRRRPGIISVRALDLV
jgi:D-3-phosphoglycerate dehydrogenase|tara:strand:+ start:2886 stop:4454 length:1569 start_codon:yes stop_codon:yes gene_type:complete